MSPGRTASALLLDFAAGADHHPRPGHARCDPCRTPTTPQGPGRWGILRSEVKEEPSAAGRWRGTRAKACAPPARARQSADGYLHFIDIYQENPQGPSERDRYLHSFPLVQVKPAVRPWADGPRAADDSLRSCPPGGLRPPSSSTSLQEPTTTRGLGTLAVHHRKSTAAPKARDGGAYAAARSRRRHRPRADGGGHERRRVRRRHGPGRALISICISSMSTKKAAGTIGTRSVSAFIPLAQMKTAVRPWADGPRAADGSLRSCPPDGLRPPSSSTSLQEPTTTRGLGTPAVHRRPDRPPFLKARDGGAHAAARSRRSHRPKADGGGHERRRVRRRHGPGTALPGICTSPTPRKPFARFRQRTLRYPHPEPATDSRNPKGRSGKKT